MAQGRQHLVRRNGVSVFAPAASRVACGRGHCSQGARHNRPGSGAPCGEPTCRAPATAVAGSRSRTAAHGGIVAYGRSDRGRRRGSRVPRLHAAPDRAALRVASCHSGYRDDVRRRSSGLHADSLAVLRGRCCDLRHRDVPDRLDSACRGAAHGWERLFEPRALAARPRRMAGVVRSYGANMGRLAPIGRSGSPSLCCSRSPLQQWRFTPSSRASFGMGVRKNSGLVATRRSQVRSL